MRISMLIMLITMLISLPIMLIIVIIMLITRNTELMTSNTELITRNTLVGPAVRGQRCCGTNNRVTPPLADETKATTLFTNLLFQK